MKAYSEDLRASQAHYAVSDELLAQRARRKFWHIAVCERPESDGYLPDDEDPSLSVT
jgi:hypothetical protein